MKISPARIQVRFSDLDVMQHVNNSVYLSYFEYARVHYFGLLLGTDWNWKKDGVLLVHNEIDYYKPIFLTDEPEISMFTLHIGEKSFTLAYEIRVGETVTTTGKSVLVCYDASKGKSILIPEKMREALQTLILE